MNKITYVVFVFSILCCSTGSLAQNKVVLIPLFSEPRKTHDIPTVTTATGRVWMDRNLGASKVAESVDDERAYGWLYQWGRLSDGHQDPSSPDPDDVETSSTDNPGHGKFIRTSTSPYDWRVPQNDKLWQGLNGKNNPCPPGFRLPIAAEWSTERASWGSNPDATDAFASPLRLVVSGSRSGDTGEINNLQDRYGSYWASTIDTSFPIKANLLYIRTDGYSAVGVSLRSDGRAVRCIQD